MSSLRKFVESKGEKWSEGPDRRVATVAVMHGSHLLMGLRRDNGKWTTPGGHADDGEDLHSAAVRELEEESGIAADHDALEPLDDPHTVTNDQGETVECQPFVHQVDARPSLSGKDDPDAEIKRWQWVDISRGLPDDIKKNLHVPIARNVLMRCLGLHGENQESDMKHCGNLSKYMQQKGIKDIQIGHEKPLTDGAPVEDYADEGHKQAKAPKKGKK